VRCPACGFTVGEALPPSFEPPTTYQAEAPTPRTVLANPEVLVQSAEPRRRSVVGGDDLAEPDIRLASRFTITAWVLLTAIFACTICLVGFFMIEFPHGTSQKDTALTQVKALGQSCDAFFVKNGKFPGTLNDLLAKDDGGIPVIGDPSMLIDPWGQQYQYDAAGPKNNGIRADVWTVSPDGQTIGNWPAVRH
jgi:hypothetical protein